MLHHHVARLRDGALRSFCEKFVEFSGTMTQAQLLDESRPVIFATPQYGSPTVGCVALAHLLRERRVLNVCYDMGRGAELAPFVEHAGLQTTELPDGLPGIRAALRALERGECLAMLPDAFSHLEQALVVPFFNRLIRVTSCVASLALRTRALIVPAFAVPRRKFGLSVIFDAPIDPAGIVAADERQALFTLTHLLFVHIENRLRVAPEHWLQWGTLPQVSTPLGVAGPLGGPQLFEALKAKFHALPPAVQDIPELELLLE